MNDQEDIKTKFETLFKNRDECLFSLIIYWFIGQFFKDKMTSIESIDQEKIKTHLEKVIPRLNHTNPVLLIEGTNLTIDKTKAEGVLGGILHTLYYEPEIDLYEFYYCIFHKLAKAHIFTDGNKRVSFIFLYNSMFSVANKILLFDYYYKTVEKLLEDVVADKEGSKDEFIGWLKKHEHEVNSKDLS